jgi:hypothetical protein
LLTEAWLLALIGVAAGLPLAVWAIEFVVSAAPPQLPRLSDASLDWRAAAVAASLVFVTGLLFGVVPAMQLGGRRGFQRMGDGTRRTAAAGTWRMRAALVAGNMAMATVLVAPAAGWWRAVCLDCWPLTPACTRTASRPHASHCPGRGMSRATTMRWTSAAPSRSMTMC